MSYELFSSLLTPSELHPCAPTLVEFEKGFKVGLLKMAQIEKELSEILGRKVDLRTPKDLSRYFRGEVLENAEVAYVQG